MGGAILWSQVINYDLPVSSKDYIHRVGASPTCAWTSPENKESATSGQITSRRHQHRLTTCSLDQHQHHITFTLWCWQVGKWCWRRCHRFCLAGRHTVRHPGRAPLFPQSTRRRRPHCSRWSQRQGDQLCDPVRRRNQSRTTIAVHACSLGSAAARTMRAVPNADRELKSGYPEKSATQTHCKTIEWVQ